MSTAEALKSMLRPLPLATRWYRARRKEQWIASREKAWGTYQTSTPNPRLNIGSGIHVRDGWFNVDCYPFYPGQYYMDATQAFPFADRSFSHIFSEHMIEHVPYLEGCAMLSECWRVLRSGGRIRIATPDLERIANLYSSPLSHAQQRYVDSVIAEWRMDFASKKVGIVVNNIFQFEHKFIYDRDTLGEALMKAGFFDVVEYAPNATDDPAFASLNTHASDDDYITFETLVLEATKH